MSISHTPENNTTSQDTEPLHQGVGNMVLTLMTGSVLATIATFVGVYAETTKDVNLENASIYGLGGIIVATAAGAALVSRGSTQNIQPESVPNKQ